MKKLMLVMVLSTLVAFAAPAVAGAKDKTPPKGGFVGGEKVDKPCGGYTGPNATLVTVAEALKLPDEAKVTLVGKIEKRTGPREYQFSDGTGAITLEISDKRWRGQTVGPDDTVEIQGEVEVDFKGREIEVKRLIKK